MNKYSLSKTKNVQNAERMIKYLLHRPKTKMSGLGLVYGRPGLGKSEFATSTSILNHYVYLRLEATMSPKSFLQKLLYQIRRVLNVPIQGTTGTTQYLYDQIIETINGYGEVVIFLDEIDYAFKKDKILSSIRDIADETIATIIMVGMETAYNELFKKGHHFDRCNYFCEFLPIDEHDVATLCSDVPDIEIDSSLFPLITKQVSGNIRKLVKVLYSIESISKSLKITKFGPKEKKYLLG